MSSEGAQRELRCRDEQEPPTGAWRGQDTTRPGAKSCRGRDTQEMPLFGSQSWALTDPRQRIFYCMSGAENIIQYIYITSGKKKGEQNNLDFAEILACYGSEFRFLILTPLSSLCVDREGVDREMQGRNEQGQKA